LPSERFPIRYLGPLFVPEEEACFCAFAAASADQIARANAVAGVAFARITPFVRIEPDAGDC
jgi:hypothetical protein